MSKRKKLVKNLDRLFSLYIRKRDKIQYGMCPFHIHDTEKVLKQPIQCCFHFITESKYSVRWDERNAVGSCHGCNLKMEHDTTFMDYVFDWYKTHFGLRAWKKLIMDSHKIAKFGMSDLKKIEENIEKKLHGPKTLDFPFLPPTAL